MEREVINRNLFPFYSLKMGTFSVPSQGIALGNHRRKFVALKGQKLSSTRYFKAFALTGRIVDCHYTQGDALG